MKAKVVVQTDAARLFLHVYGTVTLACHVIAAAANTVALLAIRKAVVARFAPRALPADHVRLAGALTTKLVAFVFVQASFWIASTCLGAIIILRGEGES